MGSHSLLQGIFLTQGSNPYLLHCRQILNLLSHRGSPFRPGATSVAAAAAAAAKSLQSCPTLCDPRDCSPSGSSVHGILQGRILEWEAIPFSRGLPDPGIERSSPILQAESLPSEPPGKPEIQSITNSKTSFSVGIIYPWDLLRCVCFIFKYFA